MQHPNQAIYEWVPGHRKPAFGFWVPDHPLSADELDRAVETVRRMDHFGASWFRCQELARLAQNLADPSRRPALLHEAFANAAEQTDPNRIVTLASSPLRTLLDVGDYGWFEREFDRLLPIALSDPNPFSRQDALYALLFVDAPQACFDRVLQAFREACSETEKALTVQRVAQYIDNRDHALAVDVCLRIRDPKRRRRALRKIGEKAERPGSEL